MNVSEDLKAALGQCFWIGLNGTSANDPDTRRIFDTFQPGGVILFQRNVVSMRQVKAINAALMKRSTVPLLLAIDQEGGTVERLHELIGTIPPAMAFVAAGSKRLVRNVHRSHARLLRYLGFNVNFTPVLDLALPDADNAIGTRCYSNNPNVVAEWAREVIEVHLAAGVLPCGKHFPGLGDARLDTHVEMPTVSSPWSKIEKKDLLPYRKLLDLLPFIMVNHAMYPEKNEQAPASLSREIVTSLLLEDWNYRGLSISDDLHMGAVSRFYSLAEASERALLAGNHMVLICKPDGVVEAFEALFERLMAEPRLAQSVVLNSSRILTFKLLHMRKPRPPVDPQKEREALKKASDAVSQKAITVIRSRAGLVHRGEPGGPVTVFLPRTKWLKENTSALGQYLRKRGRKVTEVFYPMNVSEEEAKNLSGSSQTRWNIVVLANALRFPNQRVLLEGLLLLKKQVAVISGAFPLDSIPRHVDIALNTYWTAPSALEAAARVLLGERKANGILPLKV